MRVQSTAGFVRLLEGEGRGLRSHECNHWIELDLSFRSKKERRRKVDDGEECVSLAWVMLISPLTRVWAANRSFYLPVKVHARGHFFRWASGAEEG